MFGYDSHNCAAVVEKGKQGKPQHPDLPSNQMGPFSTSTSHGNSVQVQSSIFPVLRVRPSWIMV